MNVSVLWSDDPDTLERQTSPDTSFPLSGRSVLLMTSAREPPSAIRCGGLRKMLAFDVVFWTCSDIAAEVLPSGFTMRTCNVVGFPTSEGGRMNASACP